MKTFPKINSLWKRHDWYLTDKEKYKTEITTPRMSFIEGDYSDDVFGNIKTWLVSEKIDGTNIRIKWSNEDSVVTFAGRTNNSDIPKHLLNYLNAYFTSNRMASLHNLEKDGEKIDIILFGEGYGSQIQKVGGNYRKDVGFILFDVFCNGWWLKQESVKEMADKLEIPYAPIIGIMTEEEIVKYVKSKPLSECSLTPQTIEGVIARSHPLVLKRDGDPVVFKLKCKEF